MAPNKSKNRSNLRHSNTQRSKQSPRQIRHNNPKPTRHFGCGICQADHRLSNCKKFERMNLAEKYKTALNLHYCINCLARNHLIAKCDSMARCQKCNGKHHTALHGPKRLISDLTQMETSQSSKQATPPIPAPRKLTTSSTSVTPLPKSMTRTLVPTALVKVELDGKNYTIRALLNPSLTSSRIAASFIRDSSVKGFKIDDDAFVKSILSPNIISDARYELCLLVTNDLPRNPYPATLDNTILEKFRRISLADPEFYSNTPVAMEIGGDLYTTLLQPNVIHIDGGSLIAQDSTLGWLVMGSMKN